MHHDEEELLSVWEGRCWDDNKGEDVKKWSASVATRCTPEFPNKGGWLNPELCAKARREEVEYIRRHKMYTGLQRNVLT